YSTLFRAVAAPLSFGGATHQTGDVHEGEPRRNGLSALRDRRQLFEARVWNANLAHVRLNGAERVVGGFRSRGLSQRVEESGLADIRQAHDAAFKAHEVQSCPGKPARWPRSGTQHLSPGSHLENPSWRRMAPGTATRAA